MAVHLLTNPSGHPSRNAARIPERAIYFRAKREKLETVKFFVPEIQGQNLAVTVLYVGRYPCTPLGEPSDARHDVARRAFILFYLLSS